MNNLAKITRFFGVGILCLGLSACESFHFPFERQLEVQQGNVITQQMVNQLRPGMAQNQVKFILGSPVLADTFDKNRWDYVYTYQLGTNKRQEKMISVYFDKNKHLTRLTGTMEPQGAINAGARTHRPGQEVELPAPLETNLDKHELPSVQQSQAEAASRAEHEQEEGQQPRRATMELNARNSRPGRTPRNRALPNQ